MKELKEKPYCNLKTNQRAYEIMLLRDIYNNSFTEIAKKYGISSSCVREKYIKIKTKKIVYYINHLSIIFGYQDWKVFRNFYEAAEECYAESRSVIAYFEKTYGEILEKYRAGEPGMPEEFIKALPPFQTKWDDKIILHIIDLHGKEKKTFIEIGTQLKMTKYKAMSLYDNYYHRQVVNYINQLEEKLGGEIWRHYFNLKCKSKKRLEILLQDHPELVNSNGAFF